MIKEESWIKTIFKFANQCRGKISISVLGAIISVFAGIIPYWCVYKIITLFVNEKPVLSDILMWCGVALISYVIRYVSYGISTTLSHISAYTILENIRLQIASKLLKAPLGSVLSKQTGNLKNILVDRVETIELPLAHMIPECISNLLLPIGVFIYLVNIDWRMAVSMLITVPIAFTAYAIMMKNFNKQYDNYMKSSNYVNNVVVEYVEGIEVIKAFNQSSTSYEKFTKAINRFKEDTLTWFKSTWKLMNFGNAVLPSTFLGVLPMGMYLYSKGSITPEDFCICLILSLGIISPLMNFTTYVNETKTIEYAVNDVRKLLNMEELEDVSERLKLNSYTIELENVSFSYDESFENKVLSNITLNIPEKKFTALVGESGSGKSTIARLIARFWDINNGEIKIGGKNIKKMPLSQLADSIGYVTQDNFLFNCSLKENIRLGNPNASDEEVITASKRAYCDEFINNLENGYETLAGDAGNKLSGGEKQRIAIARMILKDAPIVILDEATAFCDPENEDKLQKSLNALTKGKTLLVIAHRLSTIKNADQIIILKNGKVYNSGSQEYLMENCSLYKSMWEAHVGSKNWTATSNIREEVEL